MDPQEIGVMLKGARILLAEDDIMNQMMTAELLINEGILVDTADNGREAVEAATRTHYDAILMDVSMPELDGLEATRRIRLWETEAHGSQGDTPRVPIIATTAHAMKKDLEPCVEAGMDDYLTKPFESWQLFQTLSKWVCRESGSDVTEKGYERLDRTVGMDVEAAMERELPESAKSSTCSPILRCYWTSTTSRRMTAWKRSRSTL